MLFRVSLTAFLTLGAAAISAATPGPVPPVDRQDVLNVIYDGDAGRIEEIMTQTHAMVQSGDAPYGHLRDMFGDFDTTNPKIIAFVDDWLTQFPDSPYALTARAWVLWTTGWNVRGERRARDTYPAAMQMSYAMHIEAFGLALRAYQIDNSLLPASDALIGLGHATRNHEWSLDVLEQVMGAQPNWRTLRHGLTIAHPGYGGTSDLADRMCEHFGAMISEPVIDMVRYCKMTANGKYFANRWDEVRAWLKEDPSPELDYFRMQSIFGLRPAPEEHVRFVVSYFKDTDTTDVRLADKFDMYYKASPGGEPIAHLVLERAKTHARQVLEHDPYNLRALGILLRSSHEVTALPGNGFRFKPTGSPTATEKADFHRRRLLASPFRDDYWKDYAQSLSFLADSSGMTAESLSVGNAAWQNAIAYSNHNLDHVNAYLSYNLTLAVSLSQSEELHYTEKWYAALAGTDRYIAIICPLIRTARLAEAMVATGAKSNMVPGPGIFQEITIEALRGQARYANRCEQEDTAQVEDLAFEPVAVALDRTDAAQTDP